MYGADGRLVYATEENFDPHCPPEVLETVVPLWKLGGDMWPLRSLQRTAAAASGHPTSL